MIIHIARIPEQGLHLTEEEPPEILGLTERDEFAPEGPVDCRFYVQVVSGSLIVRGSVTAPVRVRCARCTQIFSTTAADSAFLRDYPGIRGTEEVDITEDIREAVLLNLPHFPLCGEGCKGLCPRCGNDLNRGACVCSDRPVGGAWDALSELKL